MQNFRDVLNDHKNLVFMHLDAPRKQTNSISLT
jgi:hypothetical protein